MGKKDRALLKLAFLFGPFHFFVILRLRVLPCLRN